jgi:hypothetical protein
VSFFVQFQISRVFGSWRLATVYLIAALADVSDAAGGAGRAGGHGRRGGPGRVLDDSADA